MRGSEGRSEDGGVVSISVESDWGMTQHQGLAESLTCCVTLAAVSPLWFSREDLAWKIPEVPLVSGKRENTSKGSEVGTNKQVQSAG